MRTLAIITALALTGSALAERTVDVDGDGEFTFWDVSASCWKEPQRWDATEEELRIYDFNDSGRFGDGDFDVFMELAGIPHGDFNVSGRFDEQDFVQLFSDPVSVQRYADGFDGVHWHQGDANCSNGIFNNQDFVFLFEKGTYLADPPLAVPEPSAFVLLAFGFLIWRVRR